MEELLKVGTILKVNQNICRINSFIAKGGFAQVYSVLLNSTMQKCVLKRIKMDSQIILNSCQNEILYMKQKNQKNIVKYIDSQFFSSSTSHEVYILMELCEGGHLVDYLNNRLSQRLSEFEVLNIFLQICDAVAVLHTFNPPIIHRDLKIENILLNEDHTQFKLCDFGSASNLIIPCGASLSLHEIKLLEDEINRFTTKEYRPPELLDFFQKQGISEKIDIWTTPFEETGKLGILNGRYSIPIYPQYSDNLITLIGSMLTLDPAKRPSIHQIIDFISKMLEMPQIHLKEHLSSTTVPENVKNSGIFPSTPVESIKASLNRNSHPISKTKFNIGEKNFTHINQEIAIPNKNFQNQEIDSNLILRTFQKPSLAQEKNEKDALTGGFLHCNRFNNNEESKFTFVEALNKCNKHDFTSFDDLNNNIDLIFNNKDSLLRSLSKEGKLQNLQLSTATGSSTTSSNSSLCVNANFLESSSAEDAVVCKNKLSSSNELPTGFLNNLPQNLNNSSTSPSKELLKESGNSSPFRSIDTLALNMLTSPYRNENIFSSHSTPLRFENAFSSPTSPYGYSNFQHSPFHIKSSPSPSVRNENTKVTEYSLNKEDVRNLSLNYHVNNQEDDVYMNHFQYSATDKLSPLVDLKSIPTGFLSSPPANSGTVFKQ
ncbi:hypothetical protein HK099_004300 [Clydaea vesicula]|uniref:non-specific serine/threonine protein kinase n=1 Tax=Clydaea vesicula TaxID=447962 RepID=A0AAD5UC81_9FUNG|nr:hypothetical protein HK099_004300 [Clydaea vesicula]